jgi:hypothetical protein
MSIAAVSLRRQRPFPLTNCLIGITPDHLGQSLASSIEANKDLEIERLAKDYQFKDYAAVRTFLESHSFLILLLREAHHKIKSLFGYDTVIALEVFTDPESDDDSKLFGLIFTALPVNEALAHLDKLDQEWWLDASARAQGSLNFDVEYI